MTKIMKCKFCGKLPHMMVCKGDDIQTEYKLNHWCSSKQNIYSNCGNWYETKRMAILERIVNGLGVDTTKQKTKNI